ncbi:hypothetical protein LTR09_002787 [Extremus antarcticus]|uniref:Ubiquitin-like domain-containing protein n=1 Tax=Extremus antarcticus TaxID=702011 RepID=A0AAJ0GF18_9PEZI|nr:hypothetical protein LTR09_002787 [Extremus antarcticus]
MGCCQSTSRSSSPPPPTTLGGTNDNDAVPHNSSRAAINQPSRSLSTANSEHGSTIIPPKPLRPNQPIRPPTPLPSSPAHLPNHPPPWTRSQLERERDAFFDTRVSGNGEVWKALRVVCDEVRKGNVEEAQAIMDALGMTCPNGRIAKGRGRGREKGGVYDERGEMYEVPTWVVTDPEDVVEDGEKEGEEGSEAGVNEGDGGDGVRRDEKGKGRAEDPGEMVRLRARLSDRGSDIIVSVGTKQKVAEVVRSIRQRIGEKRVRLMYLGKTLDERTTLEESGWVQGHVLNAMVFEGEEGMLPKAGKKSK